MRAIFEYSSSLETAQFFEEKGYAVGEQEFFDLRGTDNLLVFWKYHIPFYYSEIAEKISNSKNVKLQLLMTDYLFDRISCVTPDDYVPRLFYKDQKDEGHSHLNLYDNDRLNRRLSTLNKTSEYKGSIYATLLAVHYSELMGVYSIEYDSVKGIESYMNFLNGCALFIGTTFSSSYQD